MRSMKAFLFLFWCLSLSGPAFADSLTYTFEVTPSANVSGGAGGTVGWGYTITNNSSTEELVTLALTAGSFLNGTPLSLFDFPVVAPGAQVTEDFVPGAVGLYQETFFPGTPAGTNDAGVFILSASFCSDPSNLSTCTGVPDVSIAYTATVTGAPEPPTYLLLAMGVFAACVSSRWKRV